MGDETMITKSPISSPQTDAQSQHREPVVAQRMDPQLKAKWVAALRSGAYSQTIGHFVDVRGFCCLGVLGSVVTDARDFDAMWEAFNGDISGSISAYVPFDDKWHALTAMNDNGTPFPEIADWIEANL